MQRIWHKILQEGKKKLLFQLIIIIMKKYLLLLLLIGYTTLNNIKKGAKIENDEKNDQKCY